MIQLDEVSTFYYYSLKINNTVNIYNNNGYDIINNKYDPELKSNNIITIRLLTGSVLNLQEIYNIYNKDVFDRVYEIYGLRLIPKNITDFVFKLQKSFKSFSGDDTKLDLSIRAIVMNDLLSLQSKNNLSIIDNIVKLLFDIVKVNPRVHQK